MVKPVNTSAVEFKFLPIRVRRQAMQMPLLADAQTRYLQSRAPLISNKAYWEAIVEKFETNKLGDRTLDPHINAFLDRLVDPAKSVIEFGCGIGRAAGILMARSFRNYTGIDVAKKAIEIATGRLPQMEFEVGDIITYRSARRYDAAIATDVLLYLSPEDQIKALVNLSRNLKKDAPLILRWAPDEKGTCNDVLIKEKEIEGKKIEGWVFLATEEYVQELLPLAGFSLADPILRETVTINPGTAFEKPQDYLVVQAEKHYLG